MSKPRRQRATDHGEGGQALVEFALVMPLLMLLVMALFELALLFNAFVGINRASQHGAHLAATLGPTAGADCSILRQIEDDVAAPNDRNEIKSVVIGRTTLNGETFFDKQTWTRISGSNPCTQADGTIAQIPYVLQGGSDYLEEDRCPALKGCDWTSPARSTVDNIGVSIVYRHAWATPLNAVFDFFGGGNAGWNIEQRNVFRMEPTL